MSAWTAKRFWKAVTTEPCDGGHTVRLDGRAVKTPLRNLLVMPTLSMAEAVAKEWEAQSGTVKPDTMPMTRYANSAIDKVAEQFDAVLAIVAAYGETDLLCYRALGPDTLVARQNTHWTPLLDWAANALQAPLIPTAGIVFQAQPADSLARLHAEVAAATPFQLAALHDLVAISGSLVLGLAIARHRLAPQDAWEISRIDESFQAEQWGQDEEAQQLAAVRRSALLDAARFFALCG